MPYLTYSLAKIKVTGVVSFDYNVNYVEFGGVLKNTFNHLLKFFFQPVLSTVDYKS